MPPQPGLLGGFAAGLISLANYVSATMPEVQVNILDLSDASPAEAECKLKNWADGCSGSRAFVGITTTTASYQSALSIARLAKQAAPTAITILGGHHASADPEVILRRHSDIVDLIIVGEGERSLCELLRHYPAMARIPGAAFLGDGNFVANHPPAPLGESELDEIPIFFGKRGLLGTPGKFDHATYVSARGCPLRCAFCAVGNERIRAKSVPAVVRDLEQLLDMGFSRIAIEDNFFAHAARRTRDICIALAGVKRRYPTFMWDCQTRVESLARRETIPLLVEAGCEAVYIGVESLHPEQLVYLNKTRDPERYLRQLLDEVIPSLLETDIHCYVNLQFGLPGETMERGEQTSSVLKTLGRLAAGKGRNITIFPQLHVVYPGTNHFRRGVLEGRFPSDVFESFTEWEYRQAPVLYWLGEHFAHGAGGIPEGILRPAPLRTGRYEVDTEAVFEISGTLRKLHRLPGIKVFDYGEHIVTSKAIAH